MRAMQLLKVGDTARGEGFVQEHSKHFNGMTCEVIGGLELRSGFDPRSGQRRVGICYKVRWEDGSEARVKPGYLRYHPAKRRAIDYTMNWDMCPWSPHKSERK